MFNFMKKEKTEEERAEKERRKSEKREKKKSSKREKLSADELQRLEEVRRSLKLKPGLHNPESPHVYEYDIKLDGVVGLRYSQTVHEAAVSPSSSDSASTWSASSSLSRPTRGILKSGRGSGGGGGGGGSTSRLAGSETASQTSSKLDLDDERLLMKNTQQNEIISYNKSPGFAAGSPEGSDQLDLAQFASQTHGECLGFKSKKLLSNFPLVLPPVTRSSPTEAWKKQALSRSASSSNNLQVHNCKVSIKLNREMSWKNEW